MMGLSICRRCKTDIPQERQSQMVVVCPSCGHTEGKRQRLFESDIKFNINIWSVLSTALIGAAFIHIVNWDSYSFPIVGLKVKQFMGTAQIDDLEFISEICLKRGKPDCAQEALAQAVAKDEGDLKILEKLGKVAYQRGQYEYVSQIFSKFFSRNGSSLDAAYMYAVSLGKMGQTEGASKYFDYVLRAKPEKIQITVVQSYVNMLWAQGEVKQALDLITQTRKKSTAAAYFMEQEYKTLQKLVIAKR